MEQIIISAVIMAARVPYIAMPLLPVFLTDARIVGQGVNTPAIAYYPTALIYAGAVQNVDRNIVVTKKNTSGAVRRDAVNLI